MKTLYVHIGMPKTGTTAIQNFCFENKKILNQKGYDYPKLPHIYGDAIAKVRNGHFLVPEEFTSNPEVFRKNLDTILELFKKFPNIILSDEAIWTPVSKCKNMWKALKEEGIRNGYQIKSIVYLRRQDLYLSSIWNQYIKGKSETIPWAEFVKNPSWAGKMKYGTNLKYIVSVLGMENVIVRRFEPEYFVGGSIYADFLNAAGLEMTDEFVLSQYVRNTKLAGNTHEIMRIINGMPGMDREKNKFFSKDVLLTFSDVSGAEYKTEMFAKDEAREFMQKYAAENQKVSDMFFNGEELFDQTFKDTPKWEKNNPYMYDDMIRFVVTCCLRLMEKNEELGREVERLGGSINKNKNPLLSIGKKAVKKIRRR